MQLFKEICIYSIFLILTLRLRVPELGAVLTVACAHHQVALQHCRNNISSYCIQGRSQTLICFSDISYLLRNTAEDPDYFIACIAFEFLCRLLKKNTWM